MKVDPHAFGLELLDPVPRLANQVGVERSTQPAFA